MLREASIKKRLTLLITVISCFAVLMTTLTITMIGYYNLKQNLISELQVTTKVVGERNQALISFGDVSRARENLKIFASKPSIMMACLYTDDGKVFAGYPSEDTDTSFSFCPLLSEKDIPSKKCCQIPQVRTRVFV